MTDFDPAQAAAPGISGAVGRTSFGALPDGGNVDRVRLSGGGLEVAVLSYGAVLQDILFEGERVVLGLPTLKDYVEISPHCGAIAGRYANRIADGRFTLDGVEYKLPLNENGRTHLHGGGKDGFGHRNWRLVTYSAADVTLELVSPDGDVGYPGTLTATCRYSIEGAGHLRITLEATADAPTIVNLAAHSYFNLDGSPTILDHMLEVFADRYLPVDQLLLPVGGPADVGGTPFDFRTGKPIGIERVPLDHNWVVSDAATPEPRLVARAWSPKSGIQLELFSTEPGLQVYDGNMIDEPLHGLGPEPYPRNGGFCMEPQRFPNSPNRPDFPSAVLRPGETYRQVTDYRFSRIAGDRGDRS